MPSHTKKERRKKRGEDKPSLSEQTAAARDPSRKPKPDKIDDSKTKAGQARLREEKRIKTTGKREFFVGGEKVTKGEFGAIKGASGFRGGGKITPKAERLIGERKALEGELQKEKRVEEIKREKEAKLESLKLPPEGTDGELLGGQTLKPREITEEELEAGLTQELVNEGMSMESFGEVTSAEPLVQLLAGGGLAKATAKKAGGEVIKGITRKEGVMSLDDFASWGKNEVAKSQYATYLKQQGIGKVEIMGRGTSRAQATKAWEAGSKVAPDKLRSLIPKTKGGKVAALVGIGILFERTFSYQSMVFWAAADNIGTTGAMRANSLRDQAIFGDLNRETYAGDKAEIEGLFRGARSSMLWASFINPVTAYFNYKFFGSALTASEDSTIQTFAEIDKILGIG